MQKLSSGDHYGRHEFAIYVENLSELSGVNCPSVSLADGSAFEIRSHDTVCRIGSVLRLRSGDSCVLFDRSVHVGFTCGEVTNKKISGTIEFVRENIVLSPVINCIVPVLKRDAMEQVIYSLTEVGASCIVLVKTERVQRKFGGEKELERLRRIIISAAEQSKNFSFPTIEPPKDLELVMKDLDCLGRVCFDVAGRPLWDVASTLREHKDGHSISLVVGPESGLSKSELAMLVTHGFITCKLTPTTLRAHQAAAFATAAMRSLVSD